MAGFVLNSVHQKAHAAKDAVGSVPIHDHDHVAEVAAAAHSRVAAGQSRVGALVLVIVDAVHPRAVVEIHAIEEAEAVVAMTPAIDVGEHWICV